MNKTIDFTKGRPLPLIMPVAVSQKQHNDT